MVAVFHNSGYEEWYLYLWPYETKTQPNIWFRINEFLSCPDLSNRSDACYSVTRLSVSIDFTDVTLVSEDTYEDDDEDNKCEEGGEDDNEDDEDDEDDEDEKIIFW